MKIVSDCSRKYSVAKPDTKDLRIILISTVDLDNVEVYIHKISVTGNDYLH